MCRLFVVAALFIALMDGRAAGQEVSKVYEHLKVLEPLIGKATGKSTFQTFQVTATQEQKWGDRKECIVFREVFKISEEDAKKANLPENTMTLSGVIGWDLARQRIKELWFGSDGSSAITYLKVEGNHIVGDRDLTSDTGQITPITINWTINNDGTQVWEEVNRVTGEVSRTYWTRESNDKK